MRVLDWVIKRVRGEVDVVETAIGKIPHAADLNLDGINVPMQTMAALLEVDGEAWKAEIAEIGEYLNSYGERTPDALKAEQIKVREALG